ncbi:hypothetical protein F5X96DRAFT_678595 [Biscogniauxia mediterranea]|nr:hypothetical protein F5X96DRAFT_678595 [Biscogniauxia mediterranea]
MALNSGATQTVGWIQQASLAFNDYMTIVAMVFATGTVIICLVDACVGSIGIHTSELLATKPWEVLLYFKTNCSGAAANTCAKLSILSLYTVISPNRRFIHICYRTMGISTACFISVMAEAFALCTPVEHNWDRSIPGGKCDNEQPAYLIAGIMNLVIDAFIVALPMPMLFGLHMSLTKRLSIVGMFSLGGLVISVSEWDLSDITYVVINACLPTIKPALYRMFNKSQVGEISRASNITNKSALNASRDCGRDSGIGDIEYHDFARLGDDVPLTRIHTGNGAGTGVDEGDVIMVNTYET